MVIAGLPEDEATLWVHDLVIVKTSRHYLGDKDLALVMDWMSGADQEAFVQLEAVDKQLRSAALAPKDRQETQAFLKHHHTPAKYKAPGRVRAFCFFRVS